MPIPSELNWTLEQGVFWETRWENYALTITAPDAERTCYAWQVSLVYDPDIVYMAGVTSRLEGKTGAKAQALKALKRWIDQLVVAP